ncbi:unnamed protein product [Adineta steineri]|uniref:Uncharacterized protein n=1 Tax=Adineta steineri TaxID=433720 RepID=A0A815C3P4_9BILA|nr:unnamed protein product [Adineta steineri]CAF4276956.1 unnamed protein product [Adineta steineri]
MCNFSTKYSPDQVISLSMKNIIIPIGIFRNLKSLSMIYQIEQKDECLQLINEISNLSQLINVKLSLARHTDVPWIGQRMVDIALCHSSIKRIILLNSSSVQFYSKRRNSRFNSNFPYQKVFVPDEPFAGKSDSFTLRFENKTIPLEITKQYDVRHLTLQFNSWRLQSLVQLLSVMPSLIILNVKGRSCCNDVYGWLYIGVWDEMLQKLKALEGVNIDICLSIPFRLREKFAAKFNEHAAEKFQTCKRINLKAERRTKDPGNGCVQISASYNMN